MNRFDYREPEFKVIKTSSEDILTASGFLGSIGNAWDSGSNGGSGGNGDEVGFGV